MKLSIDGGCPSWGILELLVVSIDFDETLNMIGLSLINQVQLVLCEHICGNSRIFWANFK
jgi:hypothetical protein